MIKKKLLGEGVKVKQNAINGEKLNFQNVEFSIFSKIADPPQIKFIIFLNFKQLVGDCPEKL